MEVVDKQTYFNAIDTFDEVIFTLTQSWLEFCYPDGNERVVFLLDNVNNPLIGSFGHIKKSLGLKMLLIEGPCLRYSDYNSNLIKSFYEGISKLDFDIIEVVSNTCYNTEFEVGIRQAGYLRPAGSFYSQLSNWIKLSENRSFNSNWKRNLKKSESQNLRFKLFFEPTEIQIADFVSFYNQFTNDKGLSHKLALNSCLKLFNRKDFALGLVYNNEQVLCSGIIIHTHHKHAGLLYAAKNEIAKENRATFYMYRELFNALESNGFRTFDMEKLAPSTNSTNGVFLFKDGVKGTRVLYNGEWSFYKKAIYKPIMFFVKKYLFKFREM